MSWVFAHSSNLKQHVSLQFRHRRAAIMQCLLTRMYMHRLILTCPAMPAYVTPPDCGWPSRETNISPL